VLSGIPVQPGTINCPSAYVLTTSSPMIGAGINLASAPYSLTLPAKDYFNDAIPMTPVIGTGYNVGVDGAHH
jgi:hypothetical protein